MNTDVLAPVVAEEWWSGHLHYQEDLDRLVREVVGPVARELDRRATPYFFLRYWDGGPHVRLRVLAPGSSARVEVAALVEGHLARLVRDAPSRGSMTAEEYAEIAAYLARREAAPDHLPQLAADNAVHEVPYRREHDRYGEGPTMSAVEDHFVDSSRLALALLRARPAGGDGAALEVVMVTQSVLRRAGLLDAEGLTRAREAWRDPANQVPGLRAEALEERFAAQREPLVEAAARLLRSPDEGGLAEEWATTLTRLLAALQAADASATAPGVLDVCTHLFCNRIGVSMPSEIYLRHLATRAVEEAG